MIPSNARHGKSEVGRARGNAPGAVSCYNRLSTRHPKRGFQLRAVVTISSMLLLAVACYQVDSASGGTAPDGGDGEGDGGETDGDTGIECEGSGVWYDAAHGRCWERADSELAPDGWSALSDCEHLTLAGYDDWVLPSIDDLRSLIRGCAETETGGGCPVGGGSAMDDWTEACEGCVPDDGPGPDGCYWPDEIDGNCDSWYWSASQLPDNATFVWNAHFADAAIAFVHKENNALVRCVRTSD